MGDGDGDVAGKRAVSSNHKGRFATLTQLILANSYARQGVPSRGWAHFNHETNLPAINRKAINKGY